jgi:prolyl-tRNA synthetase
MRWSQSFIPTLRDDPAEAEAPSHRLLLRAGYIRQLTSGPYSLLPLAVRVRLKIVEIIREEMNRIGGQEFLLPAMHPAELWQRSGRDKTFDVLFRFSTESGEDIILGPTHEEVITSVFSETQSYRELPRIFYQIQTKFRNEARPKSGLLRVREFTMKDSYSFDIDAAGLDKSFDLHYEAYTRIYDRIGLDAVPVIASSGAMGGTGSVEFVAASNSGEDDIVRCPNNDYAANAERADSKLPPVEDESGPDQPERFDTPGVKTIVDLENFEDGVAANRQIKTLVYMIDGKLTLVLLRGDHELIEQKLLDGTAAISARPAQEDEIKAALGASPGSLGAVGVHHIPVVADLQLKGRMNMATGANSDGVHVRGVNVDRDIDVSQWMNLRRVQAGESCPNCGAPLQIQRGIEVGHIFKLGYKYTEALDVNVLGPDGQTFKPIMGCYGIGVERALAAAVEKHHDDKGIIWPVSIAPFQVAVLPLNADNDEVMGAANILYDELNGGGIDTLLDDRDARAGVKFADVELIGIPVRVSIGKRGIANRVVEVTVRKTGETNEIPLTEAADYIDELLRSLS